MYLPPFEYVRAGTVAEAVDTLVRRQDDDAAVYMGGTELLLLMKLGLAEPGCLIDCKHIDGFRQISVQDNRLLIGAAAAHHHIMSSTLVRELLPSLCDVEAQIGNVRIRAAGTLSGNLCFADPQSDPATLLIALGASVQLQSTAGVREIDCEEFILGPYETILRPAELLTTICIPLPVADVAVGYERIAFRERPIVNVAVVREPDGCRVVAAGGGRGPRRIREAEMLLDGHTDSTWTPEVLEAAAERVAATLDPLDGPDGKASYKRHLAAVTFRRAAGRVA
jgi:aerobic carbon-monoxide dehydrogenase medium subunit